MWKLTRFAKSVRDFSHSCVQLFSRPTFAINKTDDPCNLFADTYSPIGPTYIVARRKRVASRAHIYQLSNDNCLSRRQCREFALSSYNRLISTICELVAFLLHPALPRLYLFPLSVLLICAIMSLCPFLCLQVSSMRSAIMSKYMHVMQCYYNSI